MKLNIQSVKTSNAIICLYIFCFSASPSIFLTPFGLLSSTVLSLCCGPPYKLPCSFDIEVRPISTFRFPHLRRPWNLFLISEWSVSKSNLQNYGKITKGLLQFLQRVLVHTLEKKITQFPEYVFLYSLYIQGVLKL